MLFAQNKNKKKMGGMMFLLVSGFPIWANSEVDPTVCRPLGECLTMCQQHQGNLYADFSIPGKDCICPACDTLPKK